MRAIVRWTLNHISRSTLHRLAHLVTPLLGLAFVGRKRRCPLCGGGFRRFLPYGYVAQRGEALCPRCLSLERHRMIWLWLQRNTDLFESHPRLLHIAPEHSLMRHFRKLYGSTHDYVTADLESPLADEHFDVESIPMKDASFDVIICNHLLEHVNDDRQAMRELYRILRPGGWGILLVPEDRSRATTFEDNTITDAAERTRLFGQYDHRRVYGRDYDDRLREAGFEVERIDFAVKLTEWERKLYAPGQDNLVVVRKVVTESTTN